MKVERMDLLKRLLAVSPAITTKDTIIQSSCVVLKKGRLYTMNREVACSVISGLDPEIYCSVRARSLLTLLKKLTEEEVELKVADGRLVIVGKRRTAKMAIEAEVLLPIGSVELPKSDTWQDVGSEFTAAADLISRCTKKKAHGLSMVCVHIHPKWMEASDNSKAARWIMKSFVKDAVLVRGATLRCIIPLGMTKATESRNWLHFKNPFGLRVSLRKWAAVKYPSLDHFLSLRGQEVTFPKALADAADRAGDFLDSTDGGIKVSISSDRITIQGEGVIGEYEEEKKIEYTGPPLRFLIPPKLIGELVEQQTSCEVTEACLRVAKDSYVYLSSLEVREDA